MSDETFECRCDHCANPTVWQMALWTLSCGTLCLCGSQKGHTGWLSCAAAYIHETRKPSIPDRSADGPHPGDQTGDTRP